MMLICYHFERWRLCAASVVMRQNEANGSGGRAMHKDKDIRVPTSVAHDRCVASAGKASDFWTQYDPCHQLMIPPVPSYVQRLCCLSHQNDGKG